MRKILVSATTTLALLAMSAGPALAFLPYGPFIGPDIVVMNRNQAVVENEVVVGAYTGYNDASGGAGGDGGNTGEAKAKYGGDAYSGDGGNGGAGGDGGSVVTGDATAGAKVANVVNRNRTTIDVCGCPRGYHEPCDCIDDTVVANGNQAVVGNGVGVEADTGMNDVEGEDGGTGGSTGGAKAKCGGYAESGDGGNGGAGGDGGSARTGSSLAGAKVFNLVNTNVTRVRR